MTSTASYKHRELLGDDAYVYDTRRTSTASGRTACKPDGVQVQMDLDFFAYHEDDDTYTRTSESFCERAYTDEEIRQFIEKSGLKLVAAYAADSFDPVEEKTQRIVYVAQK